MWISQIFMLTSSKNPQFIFIEPFSLTNHLIKLITFY